MEARLAKLEASMEHVQRDVSDIKIDIRRICDIMDSNFKLTFGGLIFVALGLAGIFEKINATMSIPKAGNPFILRMGRGSGKRKWF